MSLRSRLKATAAIFVTALVWFIVHECRETDWEHNLNFKIGDRVYVRYAFYEDCTGIIKEESYSAPTTSRYGEFYPRAFAGYIVDLTCNGKEIGNRFFVVDFLRHPR